MIDLSLCIETVKGNLINPMAPDVNAIDIHDIAWALSRIPRFAGHTITETPYNVAQHSVYVSELVQDLMAGIGEDGEILLLASSFQDHSKTLLKALVHDAHEAYIGDIPSPIKRIQDLNKTFKTIEHKLDAAIYECLGLPPLSDDEKKVIKYCDKLAQAIEGYQYMPSRGKNWQLPQPTLIMLQKFPAPMTPLESYRAFLSRYEDLRSR